MNDDHGFVAMCGKCMSQTRQAIESRGVPGLAGATEWIIVCSKCGTAVHSCWDSESLAQIRREIQRADALSRPALVKKHKASFDAFQVVMDRRQAHE